ncbi:MAG: DNA polymerase III subunit delta [Halomonadaceae bacterium]|nr:MAG: DNA polymerase III subunit delta [Halomonadaceae bacterium]
MKLNPPQLPAQLKKGLAPVYLVTGDEPLLVQESCDHIRQAALAAGFSERKVFHGEPQVNWRGVMDEAQALSLFAEKQRIEVRLPSGKLGNGRDPMATYLADPSPDVVMLLSGPRLDAAEVKRPWYQTLQKLGVHVQIWPVEPAEFPGWLRQQARSMGLNLGDDAIAVLVDRVEGNLLAARQELERLQLAHSDDNTQDAREMDSSVLDNSRFNPFQLAAEALNGHTAHAQKMLTRLRLEGTATLPILAVLSRDIKHSLALQHSLKAGQPAAGYFKQQWIRQRSQIQSIESAARRLGPTQLRHSLSLCQSVDRATKGFTSDLAPWLLMEQLIQALNPALPSQPGPATN